MRDMMMMIGIKAAVGGEYPLRIATIYRDYRDQGEALFYGEVRNWMQNVGFQTLSLGGCV